MIDRVGELPPRPKKINRDSVETKMLVIMCQAWDKSGYMFPDRDICLWWQKYKQENHSFHSFAG